MSELASSSTDYSVVEGESPDIMSRTLRVSSHLWASATFFFFVPFLFAYFYLRSLDSEKLWKPKNVHVSAGWGITVTLCVVVSAALLWWAKADQRGPRRGVWRIKGLFALGFGLAAVAIQIVCWTQISFGPADGGYASVYLGWTGLYALFVVGTVYWLETCLALSFRYRHHAVTFPVEPGDASGDPYRTASDIANPVTLNTAELNALSFYWCVLAGVGVITWIVLYLI